MLPFNVSLAFVGVKANMAALTVDVCRALSYCLRVKPPVNSKAAQLLALPAATPCVASDNATLDELALFTCHSYECNGRVDSAPLAVLRSAVGSGNALLSADAVDGLVQLALQMPQFQLMAICAVLAGAAKRQSRLFGRHLSDIFDVIEAQRADPLTSKMDVIKGDLLFNVLTVAYGNPPANKATANGFTNQALLEAFERTMTLVEEHPTGNGSGQF